MSEPRPFCPEDTPRQWTRPRLFRISHTELAVTIDLDAQRLAGQVSHRCAPVAGGQGRVLELDAHDLAIGEVSLDGGVVTFSQADGRLRIPWPDDEAHTVRLAFAVDHPAKGLYFIAADPAQGRVQMAWTQGATEDHSWWFPCFDTPNNLGTYRIQVRHRAALTAVANGRREACTDHGDGWATTVHVQDLPHVLYLVNLVVGDLEGVEDPACPVPTTHWVPRGRGAEALTTLRATAFALRHLGDTVGVAYPWARYGHVVVHRFMWGGMENTTLTTITDRVLMTATVQQVEDVDADALVIHELAHQWFGDLLTMKQWADLWLNESFATYFEARGVAAFRAHLAHDPTLEASALALELWHNRQEYLDEDSTSYRRALVTGRFVDAYELFDRVAYEKGSLVLHMLARWLGERRFRAVLKLYLTRHAHDLVETADFRQAVEDATGEPADWFFAQWLERPGHPRLTVRHHHDPVRGQLVVDIEQAPGDPWRLHTSLTWPSTDPQQPLLRQVIELTRQRETLIIPCGHAPAWVCLDGEGDLLATWDEPGDTATHLARLADARLGAAGRARSAVAVAVRASSPALVQGLGNAAAGGPELVRQEAIAALGQQATASAGEALLGLWSSEVPPRLRRLVAKALGGMGRTAMATVIGERLIAWGDAETSRLVAGECFAARGALELAGATPLLRARLKQDSWNQRQRQAILRGLGASLEAAAVDDVATVLADPAEGDWVRLAACTAAGQLGAHHVLARPRLRRLLERLLDADLHLRSAAARALATMGDVEARGAVQGRLAREQFGNVRRTLREVLATLDQVAAATFSSAALVKRIDDLEAARKNHEARLEAFEKRLGDGASK